MLQTQQIEAVLPQTQCTRCGYSGCLPYARAIVEAGALHNRCHPGGESVIVALAKILDRAVIPIDPSIGSAGFRQVAFIDSAMCIGCTLCLPSCPVDSIVGGPKRLHTIDSERCTGCQLCIAPCPVDCITMVSPKPLLRNWNQAQRETAIEDYAIALARRAPALKIERSVSTASNRVENQTTISALASEKQSAAKAALAAALKKATT
jgi:Na+-translocating ferredoxin:NAD+ oxidoreductase subunit B